MLERANPDNATTEATMTSRPLSSGGAFATAEENAAKRRGLADVDDGLFDYEAPPPVSLHDKFGMPPFSILDRRSGIWQDRKRRWLSLGIRSEVGRDGGLLFEEETGMNQGALPIESRSDRALQSMVQNAGPGSAYARKAAAELARRAEEGSVWDAGPVPGGTGRNSAWRGRREDGSSAAAGEKWNQNGTARNLIPGAAGVGGAYDRSREGGTLNRRTTVGNDSTSRLASTQRALQDVRGRADGFTSGERAAGRAAGEPEQETLSGTSIFDPVLCELAYRWFTAPGMRVLDPFAGGSVRGIVAGMLERHYMGVDLRDIQIAANKAQGATILPRSKFAPRWVAGDSAEVLARAPAESVDFMWSCPPYADLEVYSDDPRDISGMPYEKFLEGHADIIGKACRALKPDRFAAWVISDVRDKDGHYRGLPAAAVEAFREAGLHFYNEQVILDPVGSAAVRSGRIFLGGRKTTRMHQLMLVFVKGSWKRATQAVAEQEQVLEVVAGGGDG